MQFNYKLSGIIDMADPRRAKAGDDYMKEILSLGKSVGARVSSAIPVATGPTKVNAQGISQPVAGSGLLRIVMYIIAGVLLLGIILMVVDAWFFPIFKKTPGGKGFVMVPGTDTTEQYWNTKRAIRNIVIGTPPDTGGSTIYSNTIAGQPSFSLTMDVLINDEMPQNIPEGSKRTFFMMGTSSSSGDTQLRDEGFFRVELDPHINRVEVTILGKATESGNTHTYVQTALIDNVPIHTPFRIGVVKTQYTMEAYLNGLLVRTIQLRMDTVNPGTLGTTTIYAPQNIMDDSASPKSLSNATALGVSTGIQVMNLRLFGDDITPSEMRARMSDLTDKATFGKDMRPTQ